MKGIMRIVISALLLILALHFILESVTFRKYIDLSPHNAEGFANNEELPTALSVQELEKENEKNKKEVKEVKEPFCSRYTDKRTEGFSMIGRSTKNKTKKELVDFINCKIPKIVGANSYPYDQNDANFQSDVMNLNRFYQKNIQETPTDNEIAAKNRDSLFTSLLPPRPDTQADTGLEKQSVRRENSLQPNTWKYQNELPMNGGEILPGITGYDTLSDQYSALSDTTSINGCVPPTRGADINDDLRMGLGVLNSGRRGHT